MRLKNSSVMRLKGGLGENGFHKFPWGIELPFKLIFKRHDMIDWLEKSDINCYYSDITYEFWFMHEDDRTLFFLTWDER